jgi:UDP:flavonoid glycosyltransferase YjiC (YdhE family)
VWPSQRRWQVDWRGQRVNSFTDFLAYTGLGHPQALAGAIAHYDTLITQFQPDAILCEQAFGAVLAAREHLPVIVTGFCMRLPPIVNGRFPSYPGVESTYSEPELLTAINRGLALAGRFPLRDITDILRVAAVLPQGPVEFDFYPGLRTEAVLPPSVPGLPSSVPTEPGNEVFLYLHGLVQNSEPAMAALAAIKAPVRAYLPDLRPESVARFSAFTLEPEPVSIEDIVRRSRCVIHHGGPQLTAACLAMGVPQVVLSKELDNRVSGSYVAANGLGETCWLPDATSEWISAAISRVLEDVELKARCRAAAPDFLARWFSQDGAKMIADRVLQSLGTRAPRTT